mmetsp:Transcript_7821/g.29275  ORF Transcript_7821/g.29275 Transcript_7821/m.29275 type:complete len:221 (+) Transcript_7821:1577-2239(+)
MQRFGHNWVLSSEHVVKDCAHTVAVHLNIVPVLGRKKYLWCHKERCSSLSLSEISSFQLLGIAKVPNFHLESILALSGDEQVGRFQVSVNNASSIETIQSTCQLPQNFLGGTLWDHLLLFDEREKRALVTVFTNEIDVIVSHWIANYVEQSHHIILATQHSQDLNLLSKSSTNSGSHLRLVTRYLHVFESNESRILWVLLLLRFGIGVVPLLLLVLILQT